MTGCWQTPTYLDTSGWTMILTTGIVFCPCSTPTTRWRTFPFEYICYIVVTVLLLPYVYSQVSLNSFLILHFLKLVSEKPMNLFFGNCRHCGRWGKNKTLLSHSRTTEWLFVWLSFLLGVISHQQSTDHRWCLQPSKVKNNILRVEHSRRVSANYQNNCTPLCRAKIVSTTLALTATKYLHKERDYIPWESALGNLNYYILMFDRTEVYGALQVRTALPWTVKQIVLIPIKVC